MLANPKVLFCLLACGESLAKSYLKGALPALPCATAQDVHRDIAFHCWLSECESKPAF